MYDHLFEVRDPNKTEEGKDFLSNLNPGSLNVLEKCYIEPSVKGSEPGKRYQFERLGYFIVDPKDTTDTKLVFNRIVSLKDTWAKVNKQK